MALMLLVISRQKSPKCQIRDAINFCDASVTVMKRLFTMKLNFLNAGS